MSTEVELVASACGPQTGAIAAIRLDADWPTFLAKLPRLGFVKAVTRNASAVIEVEGTYDNIEFFGAHMGQSVSTIDLRIFVSRWGRGFAVREETKRGLSRGFQFFDKNGRAVHKLYLREASDAVFYETLVREHLADDQGPRETVEAPSPLPRIRPDSDIHLPAFRADWEAMKDTHEFFMLLRKHDVVRTQALRLIGPDLAAPAPIDAATLLLNRVANTDLPIMAFVGNPGMIQIHTGPIKKVVTMGAWLNVLDPGFDFHLRTDRIASAWVVRKPTADGVVTSLELYDASGDQIVLFVGKRKPGQQESGAWREVVESLLIA